MAGRELRERGRVESLGEEDGGSRQKEVNIPHVDALDSVAYWMHCLELLDDIMSFRIFISRIMTTPMIAPPFYELLCIRRVDIDRALDVYFAVVS